MNAWIMDMLAYNDISLPWPPLCIHNLPFAHLRLVVQSFFLYLRSMIEGRGSISVRTHNGHFTTEYVIQDKEMIVWLQVELILAYIVKKASVKFASFDFISFHTSEVLRNLFCITRKEWHKIKSDIAAFPWSYRKTQGNGNISAAFASTALQNQSIFVAESQTLAQKRRKWMRRWISTELKNVYDH